MGLHLVLAPTPADLPRSRHVAAAREASLRALAASARLAGVEPRAPDTDEAGAPLPWGAWHWSLAHTRGLALALVAPGPAGVDVERLDRARVADLTDRIVSPAERALLDDLLPATLLRVWTAKEAVLKRAGVGLAELDDCRLAGPLGVLSGEGEAVVRHRGAVHRVLQWHVDAAGDGSATHVVAACCEAGEVRLTRLEPAPATEVPA